MELPDRTALVVVDVQQGFDEPYWGPGDNPDWEANIARLVEAWHGAGWPLVYVRHDSVTPGSPLRPELPGNALRPILTGEPDLLVRKQVNSAFYGDPPLEPWLRERGIGAVAICGLTTNHCCDTTARMAANLGFEVFFALDATRSFDLAGPDGETVPAADLTRATAASLHGEFATVCPTGALVGALGS